MPRRQWPPAHSAACPPRRASISSGLPWQSRRRLQLHLGVWHDAKYIADQIVIQRSYMAYHDANVSPAHPEREAALRLTGGAV